MILLSLLPAFYYARTRLPSTLERISWLLLNPVPLGLAVIGLEGAFLIGLAVVFVLVFLALQSVHDIGYVENDVFTVKREENPSLRLTPEEMSSWENHFRWWMLTKWLIAISFTGLAWFFSRRSGLTIHPYWFLLSLLLLWGAFKAHNYFRSRINILTYFTLCGLKYLSPLIYFFGIERISVFVLGITMFPLLRTMEHASRDKYHLDRWQRWVGNVDWFRVKYYGILLAGTLIASRMFPAPQWNVFFVVYSWYAVLRMFTAIAARDWRMK